MAGFKAKCLTPRLSKAVRTASVARGTSGAGGTRGAGTGSSLNAEPYERSANTLQVCVVQFDCDAPGVPVQMQTNLWFSATAARRCVKLIDHC